MNNNQIDYAALFAAFNTKSQIHFHCDSDLFGADNNPVENSVTMTENEMPIETIDPRFLLNTETIKDNETTLLNDEPLSTEELLQRLNEPFIADSNYIDHEAGLYHCFDSTHRHEQLHSSDLQPSTEISYNTDNVNHNNDIYQNYNSNIFGVNNTIPNSMNNILYDQSDNMWTELQTYTQGDAEFNNNDNNNNNNNGGRTHVITSTAASESNEELELLLYYLLMHYQAPYEQDYNNSQIHGINHFHQQQEQQESNPVAISTTDTKFTTYDIANRQVKMIKEIVNSNNNNHVKPISVSPVQRHSSSLTKRKNTRINISNQNNNNNRQSRNSHSRDDDNIDNNRKWGIYTNRYKSNNNRSQRLSDTMCNGVLSTKRVVTVLTNFPWDVSIKDIERLLSHDSSQYHDYQYIHIIIDRSTGKTRNKAFIEFNSKEECELAMKKVASNPALKGRNVILSVSSSEELFLNMFPCWRGRYIDNREVVYNSKNKYHNVDRQRTNGWHQRRQPRHINTGSSPLIKEHEYNSLLNACRNYYQLHYLRNCPERPFENFISIMVKFPWHKPEIIDTRERNRLYKYYKLATGSLRYHLNKSYNKFESTLMSRMVRTALVCPGLTVSQKYGILFASETSCPNDLTHHLESNMKYGRRS